ADSTSSVRINDAPDPDFSSIADAHRYVDMAKAMTPQERDAYYQKLREDGKLLQNRIYLGTTTDRQATLVLKDARGKPRLRLAVADNGEAVVEVIGADGKVMKKMSAEP
ncbi:MAG TPA: hypothetical protein VF798_12665, partial [Burkholderiaceae bacterium]